MVDNFRGMSTQSIPKNGQQKLRFYNWIVIPIALFVGLFLGLVIGNILLDKGISNEPPVRLRGFQFTSPLLYNNNPKEIYEFKPLVSKLQESVFDLLNSPKVASVSIYFRDLSSGRWTGINENANYDPASLLKVPIMIAWLKKAEADPRVLSEKLFYKGEAQDNQGIQFHSLSPKSWYTVDELITTMITKSDNDAKDLLVTSIDLPTLKKVFSDLNIQTVGNDLNSKYLISAKTYSLFFRVLYNATYLDQGLSEKALALLSKTNFNQGIIPGIPSSIAVAHKFGQYGGDYDLKTNIITPRELHDCGIVYYPARPYLLCAMTVGTASLDDLNEIIQTISKVVYQEVGNNYQ